MMDLINAPVAGPRPRARYVVLDEADEMLDLGFIEDVEKILRMCPSGRQTALFSATMPAPVARLAETYMYDPVTIRVTPKKLTVDSVEQAYVMVEPKQKLERLVEVLKAEEPEQAIIFCRTKIGASRLDRDLADKGLRVKALHGDLSQGQRDGVMISFKEHKVPLLVATDIAARGLDIEHVTHVINYDLPNNPEIYVHRIGRTGRVGRTGRAITFATAKQAEDLKTIERVVKAPIGEWEPPEERLEHAPRPRHREKPIEKTDGAVKLFVNRGARSGIEEDDLRWALTEGAVIPEAEIHSIRVLDRFSFVELDASQADQGRRVPGRHQAQGPPDPDGSGALLASAGYFASSSIRSSSCSHSNGFGTTPSAPISAIFSGCWASRWAEMTSTGVFTPFARISFSASSPDLPGIIASSRIRSSLSPASSTRSIASLPSVAVITS